MSRLDELIAELCPNGVEYKKLKEVASVSIGEFVHKNKQNPNGVYPVYNGGTSNTGFYDEFNRTANKIIISARGANAGFVNRVFVDFWAGNSCYTISVKEKYLDWNFTYYVLKNSENKLINEQQKGGIPAVSKKQVEEFYIPLPPLPVQQEIVRILDNFTELTAELKAQLKAEIEARKKQYEYYRDYLLTFDGQRNNKVKWMTLKEVCKKISSGGTPNTNMKEYYNGNVPWLRTQEVNFNEIYDTEIKITEEGMKNSSAKWIPENCVIVALYGATAAKVAINKIPLTTNQACCNLQIDGLIANYRYVFHWLSSQYRKLKALGQGSQSNINAKTVKEYPIPVPPLEEQERIVAILDRFDALCNDLTSGIPAELEARQKQYEFYRDKLLSFKEVSS